MKNKLRKSRLGKGAIAAISFALIFAFAVGQSGQALANAPVSAHHKAASSDSSNNSESFQNLNGFMWFYNSYFNYKFSDITKNLDHLKNDGTRVLGFFAPYQGNVALCDGCDPVDYYKTNPQNGTIQDWKNLVKAAHSKGMKVVAYFVNIYMDASSPFFLKAQQEYATGDRTSREVASFDWTTDPTSPKPTLTSGPPWESFWTWSPIAKAYYWQLWFGPGFDYDLPGNVAEVASIEKFWLDTGIDGFQWDVGRLDPRFQASAVTIPTTYTKNPKWLTFELTDSAKAAQYNSFGLTSWFNYKDDFNGTVNDYYNLVTGATNADGLEAALKNVDYARSVGATTYAWSLSSDDPDLNLATHTYPVYATDDVMRVQEAALLAGSGILYGSAMYDQYIRWSPTLRANWNRVLQTVNGNKALLPSASRARVPAGSDEEVYAMQRTSTDGKQTALLIYNFHSTPSDVTVDLTGTGISTHQVPADLYAGDHASAINGTSYTVHLPAYGFEILQVSTNK